MNKITPLLVLGAALLSARDAHARSAFQTPEIMIANADAIAIVQVERTESTRTPNFWSIYGQKATAHVEQLLKGQLPASLTLLGDDLSCDPCHFETGRFLVFLKREKEGYSGNNHQLSIRKIEGDRVGWGEKDLLGNNPIPLADALSSLRTTLKIQAKAPHYFLYYSARTKEPVWSVNEEGATPSGTLMNQREMEAWLGTLPLGAKVSLLNSCMEKNASPEDVQNLQSLTYFRGVQVTVIPAG